MSTFIEYAKNYAQYHQKNQTRYIHIVAIICIVLALMILLGFVHILIPGVIDINLADMVTLGVLVFYFWLNWRITLVLTPVFILLLWIARLLGGYGPSAFSVWTFIIFLLLGATLQIVGYLLEAMRPSLKENLKLTLVAPLCLLAELLFMSGKMRTLRNEIHDTPVGFRKELP